MQIKNGQLFTTDRKLVTTLIIRCGGMFTNVSGGILYRQDYRVMTDDQAKAYYTRLLANNNIEYR